MTLFLFGYDSSLITVFGVDHNPLRSLLNLFAPIYRRYTPCSEDGFVTIVHRCGERGRLKSMTALQCLALALMWTHSRGKSSFLCLIFGVTHPLCSVFLRFAQRILVRVLQSDEPARVRMPSDGIIAELQNAFARNYSYLRAVYCVADGVKL